jgi:ribosomal protein L24
VKKGDQVRMHDVVKVNAGRLAGLAGVVEAIDGAMVTVAISGVKDGEQIDVRQTFNDKALGRIHG